MTSEARSQKLCHILRTEKRDGGMLELRLRRGERCCGGEGVEMELFRPQPDRHFSVEEGREGDFSADLYAATAGWSGAVLRPRKERRKEGRGGERGSGGRGGRYSIWEISL